MLQMPLGMFSAVLLSFTKNRAVQWRWDLLIAATKTQRKGRKGGGGTGDGGQDKDTIGFQSSVVCGSPRYFLTTVLLVTMVHAGVFVFAHNEQASLLRPIFILRFLVTCYRNRLLSPAFC